MTSFDLIHNSGNFAVTLNYKSAIMNQSTYPKSWRENADSNDCDNYSPFHNFQAAKFAGWSTPNQIKRLYVAPHRGNAYQTATMEGKHYCQQVTGEQEQSSVVPFRETSVEWTQQVPLERGRASILFRNVSILQPWNSEKKVQIRWIDLFSKDANREDSEKTKAFHNNDQKITHKTIT